ncbi:MAG: GTPase Era [Oscillospiraceae bacterium]|nr:GTPase Era [Oscillospiraceae bacterium]
MQKSAFIAIVGRPNVGKSSILNHILKQKVAIVSSKPQTTRTRIMGVYTQDEVQLVFTDTPGLHKPKTKLGDFMVKSIVEAVSGVDACLLVADASAKPAAAELELIERFKAQNLPAILALNKIDLIREKEGIIEKINAYAQLFDFKAVVPLSAKNGSGMEVLIRELSSLAEEGPHFFDDDTLTDQPERVLAGEIIREKLLRALNDEVPHGIAVGIEKMRERENSPIVDIEATIYCERESHKGIVIGKKGEMLKRIGEKARLDLERFLDCKVNLQLWVKVKDDWRNREGLLKNFGFREE